MTCLLIDNDPVSRAALIECTRQINDIGSCVECCSTMEAYNYIQHNTVDVIFLEVEMPGMNGIEFVRNLGNAKPAIIFTTTKNEYAIEAFELHVADYLLKPITLSRFTKAITKARQIVTQNKQLKQKQEEFIFIKDSNIIRRLRINDILYAEAMGDYVKLFTPEKFHAIHAKFVTVESRLPPDKFLRIHRSFIVAVNKIDSLHDRELMINGKCIPVAITYKQVLNERLNVLA